MRDGNLFPNHPCLLARADNAVRCEDMHTSTAEQCERCRTGMAPLLWDALHNGDRSLALALMPPQLHALGFAPEPYEGAPSMPLFQLARQAEADDGREYYLVPEEAEGSFEVVVVDDEDAAETTCSLTLEEALVRL